jgi:hypothetical protein
MDKELKDKLESLKSSEPVKKKKCTTCKKKKEPITFLPELINEDMFIPSPEDIRTAYIELGRKDNSKREFINNVYQFLFNEDFNFGCTSCMNVQVRRLKNYLNDKLNIKVL